MASYADALVGIAARLGIDPAWLANIIQLESGGNPQARNSISNATGLIQFMPSTAPTVGTTVSDLYQMDGRQQMPYVERYFQNVIAAHGPLRSQEDVIAAVFYPAYIGQPDREFPAAVQRDNAGLSTMRDYVRRLSATAKLPVEGIAGGALTGLGGGNRAVQLALVGSLAGLILIAAWRYQDNIRDLLSGD
jgi:hypothetical protein